MPADGTAALVISLDFELYWGVHDKVSVEAYRGNLLGVRAAVPAMLALFREFGVHATWATVGLLFFESKRELLDGLPSRRPAYTRGELSPYGLLSSVGENERDDPLHFAPSLIRHIAETPHQELGTHTFSHYYCLEAGQSAADFRADLEAATAVMQRKVGRSPRSIVFPRNQTTAACIAECDAMGLTAYRGNLPSWLYRERADGDESLLRRGVRLADAYLPLSGRNASRIRRATGAGATDVTASRYLRPYAPALRRLEPLRLRRITSDLVQAATSGRTYHLWWHPHDFGVHLGENLRVLHQILICFDELRDRYGMESRTMEEAALLARKARPVRASDATGVDVRFRGPAPRHSRRPAVLHS
jgi:peptidoglycan/xylan/chitin deacetylase (PgdA/CDA1 family)